MPLSHPIHLAHLPTQVMFLDRGVHAWITVISIPPYTSNLPTSNNINISPVATLYLLRTPSPFLWLSWGSIFAVTLVTSRPTLQNSLNPPSAEVIPYALSQNISQATRFPKPSSLIITYYPGLHRLKHILRENSYIVSWDQMSMLLPMSMEPWAVTKKPLP